MPIERLLQIHVACLTALGTLLLGMGQRSPVLPVLAIFAAITSVIFTDRLVWFRLNTLVATIIAMIAVAYTTFNFWSNASDQQLLAIANLLVYLQIVLLYQQKNELRYWQLAVLSLLQVVVAAALNLGFEFGVLLVIYMLLAFATLALFLFYRESRRYCVWENALATVPPNSKVRSLRRRLRGDPVVATSTTPAHAFAQGWLGWTFFRQISGLSLVTLVFTVVLFYSVPRTSDSVWQGRGEGGSTVGFTQEVKLNERGEIRQSDQIVMRVTFRSPDSDKPLVVAGEPYFDGTILTDYDAKDGEGRWSNSHGSKPLRLTSLPENVPYILQETSQATGGETLLFSTPLVFKTENTPRALRFDRRTGQLSRLVDYSGNSPRLFNYTVASTGFREGWQLPIIPYSAPDDETLRVNLEYEINPEHGYLLQLDRERFPTLIATADRIVNKIDKQERDVIARLLQDHFRTPNAYRYTLDFSKVQRTKGVDPIEDFIANHRTGHCEYFASALCLMLRSQGIPARMVVGYKGGEHNLVGGYYYVRQLHAHAWVEAYLEPDQVPANVLPAELVSPKGAWMRLDPTPASDEDAQLGIGVGMLARLGDVMDYAQLLWDDYVLGLNSERQANNIYAPLAEQASSALGSMLPADQFQGVIAAALALVGWQIDEQATAWFSWRAGLGAIIICAAAVLLYQALLPLSRWLRGWWQGRTRDDEQLPRRIVEFYARLETLLAKLDIHRPAVQTQREFALLAGERLAVLEPEADGLRTLPEQITEAFYRVRFGERPLSPEQADRIDHSLGELAELVDSRSHREQRR